MSRVFVVFCGVPLFFRGEIDLSMWSGVLGACVRRSLIIEFWFLEKGLFLGKPYPEIR